MFRPLSIFIGTRYTRAKRRNRFVSFISMTSMIGLALGVLAMIVVLSVMNGFQREMQLAHPRHGAPCHHRRRESD